MDGLRAVAVLPVMFFHAGLGFMSGGFVGVDVFFVVSGYLITSIILSEVSGGTFSYLGFYERRIRRIFPALFLVLAVSVPIALLVLVPEQLEDFGQSVIATATFVSNFFFYSEDGYFDGPADLHPLLHTWSLAVEEQFYLFVPVLLGLVVRRRIPVAMVLAALALMSFGFGIWQLGVDPSGAFYLLPGRFWELMLGALLAASALPAPGTVVRAAAGVGLGLAAITLAVLTFDEATPFPGFAALLPCVGTALVIHCGRTSNPVSRLLGSAPLRGIGLLSYSLYLWHFPLMVFARHLIVRPFTALEVALLITATFLLAGFSWRFVEQPFRVRPRRIQRPLLFKLAASVIVAGIAFGLFTDVSDGAPDRFSGHARDLLAANEDKDTRCLRKGENCALGGTDADAGYLVWGDSHGSALLPVFRSLSGTSGRAGRALLQPGCAPMTGYLLHGVGAQACQLHNELAFELARGPDVGTVFLAARWTMLVEQSRYGFESGSAPVLLLPGRAAETNAAVVTEALGRALAGLEMAGKRVYIIGPIPEVGWHVPHTLAQRERFDDLLADAAIAPTRGDFLARNGRTVALLEQLAAAHGARVLRPDQWLCADGGCAVLDQGRPLYYDTDHLTRTGAMLLEDMLRPAFQEMQRGGDEGRAQPRVRAHAGQGTFAPLK